MDIKCRVMSRIRSKLPLKVSLYLDRRKMREIGRQDLMDSIHVAQLRERVIQSNTSIEYLQLAHEIFKILQIDSEIIGLIKKVKEYKPEVFGEIGTFECGNLFLMTHAIPSIKKVVAIDLVFQHKGLFEALSGFDRELGFFEGYSTCNKIFRKVKHFLGDDKFDLLFIDGDHTYEGVKGDFEKYRCLVKDGGLIVFHDVVPDLTTRMKSDVPLSKAYAGGVPIFWSEIKNKYKSYEFIDDPDQDGYGIGLIEYSVN